MEELTFVSIEMMHKVLINFKSEQRMTFMNIFKPVSCNKYTCNVLISYTLLECSAELCSHESLSTKPHDKCKAVFV
jgi:hypothetical protein